MASPRPIPPATNTGTSLMSGRISCASTLVETGPICPPASAPSMISASAPILTSFLPSAAVGAKQITFAPPSFKRVIVAHENFKKAFINANARDAMPSVQYHPDFPVIPVRAIVNKASEEFTRFQKETVEKVFAGAQSKEEGQLAIEHFWAGSLRKAVIEGDVERGSLMAGQSVGMVQCIQTAQEIVDELVQQAALYLEKKAAA
jgi:hypothetical protein